jgi:hypothetical protein
MVHRHGVPSQDDRPGHRRFLAGDAGRDLAAHAVAEQEHRIRVAPQQPDRG